MELGIRLSFVKTSETTLGTPLTVIEENNTQPFLFWKKTL
jgi:hypothetical protein